MSERHEHFKPLFNVDCAALKVGSVIATSELVDLVRLTPKDRKWDARLQQVCKYIESQRPDLMAAVRRDAVVILTGDERAEQVTRSFARAVSSTISLTARAQDPVRMAKDQMSSETRRGFESVTRTMAAITEDTRRQLAKDERLAGLLCPDDTE